MLIRDIDMEPINISLLYNIDSYKINIILFTGVIVTNRETKNRQKSCYVLLMFIILCAVICALIVTIAIKDENCSCKSVSLDTASNQREPLLFCKNDAVVINPQLKTRKDIFRELDTKEIGMVIKYVSLKFNVTPFYHAIQNSGSFIALIELYLPDKRDVIMYLDEAGRIPERRAKVIIIDFPRKITFYKIGPIPNPNYHKLIAFNGKKNPLPFAPGIFVLQVQQLRRIQHELITKMWSLFQETYPILKMFDTPEKASQGGLNYVSETRQIRQKTGRIHAPLQWTYSRRPHIQFLSYIFVKLDVTETGNWKVIQVG